MESMCIESRQVTGCRTVSPVRCEVASEPTKPPAGARGRWVGGLYYCFSVESLTVELHTFVLTNCGTPQF